MNKWFELMYTLSGNVVLGLCLAIAGKYAFLESGHSERSVLVSNFLPFVGVAAVIATVMLINLAFSLLCSLALICVIMRKYQAAVAVYRLTLRLRSALPFAGKTARVAHWQAALADCYLESGHLEAAEALYKQVLSLQHGNTLDRFTHRGLRESVMVSYARLLRRKGNSLEADKLESTARSNAYYLPVKHAVASLAVLICGGVFAVWLDTQLNLLCGVCFIHTGNYEKAARLATVVIERQPRNKAAYFLRGTARLHLGQAGLAELDLSKSR